MSLSEKALEIAITQLGKEEVPRGSNWGDPVQSYLKSVGIGFPASWCMAFVYWCHNEAAKQLGIKNPMVKTGGVLMQWGKASTVYAATKPYLPGDVFIMNYGKGLGHTGIIEKMEGDFAHTIEGNTNDDGSREGYEVCRRKRPVAKFAGVLRFTK